MPYLYSFTRIFSAFSRKTVYPYNNVHKELASNSYKSFWNEILIKKGTILCHGETKKDCQKYRERHWNCPRSPPYYSYGDSSSATPCISATALRLKFWFKPYDINFVKICLLKLFEKLSAATFSLSILKNLMVPKPKCIIQAINVGRYL